jgi:hypothetical protein
VEAGAQAPRDAGDVSDASAPQDAHDAAQCTADAHEPDDTLTETEAHEPVSGIFPVELRQLTACPGDTDYVWAGRVDAGGKAGARLTWDASLGELQLALCDENGVPLTQRDVSSTSAGHAEERVDEYYGSFFYVRVTNSGGQSIPYDLTVTAQVFGP